MINSSRHKQFLTVAVLVIMITILHYFSQTSKTYYHIFYRELYFLPIMFAGFWFGLRGGLITALVVSMLYFPLVLVSYTSFTALEFGDIMEILLFNVVGSVMGWLRDRELTHQAELRKTESLAAMGKAVSYIAHDMKTPLVAIGGLTSQMRRKLQEEHSVCKKLDVVLRQTTRLEEMVKDMLAFARPLELQKVCDDFHKLVCETVEVARESARQRGVQLQVESSPKDSLMANFDLNRMQQVLLNLITNAVEASPQGELVKIQIRLHGKHVQVEVADRGEGITLERRREIFNPFFTTKKEGTGLGLAIVKKIVEAHEGTIEVLDNQDKGVLFRVVFPAD